MLTRKQKEHFYENGFLKIPGVVPRLMVDAARKAINHSIGSVGVHDDDPNNFRTGAFCDELILIPNLNVTYNPIESGDGLNNVWMSLKIKQAFN